MNNKQLIREKLAQATQILDEFGVDVWLTFVRETSLSPDSALELIAGVDMTWQSAFMVNRNGRHTAIIGFYDGENVRNFNAYEEVVGYYSLEEDVLVTADGVEYLSTPQTELRLIRP